VQQAAVMNHCCENSHCSDFFDSLSHLRSFEDLADDQQVAKGGWFSFGRLCGEQLVGSENMGRDKCQRQTSRMSVRPDVAVAI
jgi:hypothetical protein